MNKERLTRLYELSQSEAWQEIRKELLNITAEKSGIDIYFDKYTRGILYAIKIIDAWQEDYLKAVEESKKMKGDS